MEQLFLIEILVETISFGALPDPIPQKKQIYISARFGTFANLEIRYDGIAVGEETSKSADIEFSTGKSYLFPCKADRLLGALRKDPLELTVGTKTNPLIGKATFTWTKEFISMLEYCGETVGYITPTSVRNVFPLVDSNGVTTGSIDAFVRLSCFGKSIQTQFQIVPNKDAKDGAPKSQYLFKSTNAATTFQCERYGLGTSTDILPVAPVYNPIEFEDARGLSPVYQATSQSVCDSLMPSVFDLELEGNANNAVTASAGTNGNDVLCGRPPSARFIKLEELQDNTFKRTYKDEELTPENINRLLCKHRDCPAAKKFKEWGLGPLATGRGLGTVYGAVEPPTSYGLSHAYGKMERYGPYGVYYRPKRPDQDFVSKPDEEKNQCSCHDPLRLSGGAPMEECPLQDVCYGPKDFIPKPDESAGAPIEENGAPSPFGNHAPLRLSGGAPMEESSAPSPLLACKELMADFDQILAAYKKALGPCGHATCPFSENVIAESCKLVCPGRDDKHEFPLTPMEIVARTMAPADDDNVSTCGIPGCPYSRKMTQPVEEEFKLGQIKSACGDPTCPYVKRRCRLDDEDADEATVQLASLPKTCGAAKCPFTPQPPLPPIHWDCPDPLPKGLCKNPNCPIGKREQLAACIFQPPISPCHVPTCPHKLPPPCNFPGCPFGPPLSCNIPGCPYSLPPVCTDPNCPLNILQSDKPPDEEGEEIKEGAIEVCSGDTMEPCTPHTCRKKGGGSLECTTCGNGNGKNRRGACPCSGRSRKASQDSQMGEGAIEVCSGDTMEPCTPHTCMARGGDLECGVCRPQKVCPCSKRANKPPADGGDSEGAIEICSGDTLEPCTPHTCTSKRGNLKCGVCGVEEEEEEEEGDRPTEYVSGDTVEPCTPNTCAAKGGNLVCEECGGKSKSQGAPCPCTSPHVCEETGGRRPGVKKQPHLSKAVVQSLVRGVAPLKQHNALGPALRKPRKSKYVYDTGDTYPGVKIGHRECVTPRSNVPHNMGWLWNIKPPGRLQPRRGWKPGALTKTMAATIVKHRLKSGIRPLVAPSLAQKPKKRARKMNAYGVYESDSDGETIVPKPTLQIKKKDGCYMITMNPLKDPFALEENESPYVDCTPLQFKITRRPPPAGGEEEGGEESSCCCGDDDKSSSDSELDIEFTPPAGILHPEKLKKKKNVVHTDTQYSPGDFTVETETLQLEKKPKEPKKEAKKEKKGGGKKGKKGKKK